RVKRGTREAPHVRCQYTLRARVRHCRRTDCQGDTAMRPCIIIPGIQGSALQNTYPISPQTTWSTLTIIGERFTPPGLGATALKRYSLPLCKTCRPPSAC